VFNFIVITSLTGVDKQDYRPAQRSKRKRGMIQNRARAITSYESPHQFSVLSEGDSDIEDIAVPSQPRNR
jgi:hypothetical protein